MNTRVIYKAFSFFELIRTLFWRFVCVGCLFYALAHYKENPVVVAVFACFMVLGILFFGDDQITVYSDRLVHSTNSLGSLIFKNKGEVYNLVDVKAATLQSNEGPTIVEVGIIAAIFAFLPKKTHSHPTRAIFLEMADGDTVRLDTSLNRNQIERVVDEVNLLVSHKQPLTSYLQKSGYRTNFHPKSKNQQ